MPARPAAGAGRWVEVDPGRLPPWLARFYERRGPAAGRPAGTPRPCAGAPQGGPAEGGCGRAGCAGGTNRGGAWGQGGGGRAPCRDAGRVAGWGEKAGGAGRRPPRRVGRGSRGVADAVRVVWVTPRP